MKILFACGGTAGHINPAIAIANYLKDKDSNTEILFAGNPNGMERKIVEKNGYSFSPIKVLGIQRKISLRNIKNNIKALWYLLWSSNRAKKIIEEFHPDVVMGTGGYVSGPVVRKAAKMGYKTIAMENNAIPGVTTKLLAKYVDKILLDVPESMKYLPKNKNYIVTGNPVREEIFSEDREKAREYYKVGNKLCILSFGGSLGAQKLNEAVADFMAWHLNNENYFHIHGSGSYYGPSYYYEMLKQKGVNAKDYDNLIIREYIEDMPRCLAAADIVICRCGAITLAELKAAGKASILIPSPNVAENHQYHNAMVLVNHDAASIIEEKNLTGQSLCDMVKDLANNPEKIKMYSENAKSMSIKNANERIRNEILSLVNEN